MARSSIEAITAFTCSHTPSSCTSSELRPASRDAHIGDSRAAAQKVRLHSPSLDTLLLDASQRACTICFGSNNGCFRLQRPLSSYTRNAIKNAAIDIIILQRKKTRAHSSTCLLYLCTYLSREETHCYSVSVKHTATPRATTSVPAHIQPSPSPRLHVYAIAHRHTFFFAPHNNGRTFISYQSSRASTVPHKGKQILQHPTTSTNNSSLHRRQRNPRKKSNTPHTTQLSARSNRASHRNTSQAPSFSPGS